jgi:Uncharacterised protein family UPF0047
MLGEKARAIVKNYIGTRAFLNAKEHKGKRRVTQSFCKLALGTWQYVLFLELDGGRKRSVFFQIHGQYSLIFWCLTLGANTPYLIKTPQPTLRDVSPKRLYNVFKL